MSFVLERPTIKIFKKAAACAAGSILLFAFISCQALFGSSDSERPAEEQDLIEGNFFLPEEIARTVEPVISGTLYYTVNATNDTQHATGSVDPVAKSFSILIPTFPTSGTSTWTITLTAYKTKVSEEVYTNKCYQGSASILIGNSTRQYTNVRIYLDYLFSGSASQDVSLELDISALSKYSISSVLFSLDGGAKETVAVSAGMNPVISKASIATGNHSLLIEFVGGRSGSGTYSTLFECQESLVVISGEPTFIWNGNADYIDTANRAFKLTDAVLDKYRRTTFYVSSQVDSSDSNPGTLMSPLKTVQAAVDKIVSLNDGTTNWTIKILGKITAVPDDARITANDYSTIKIPDVTSTLNLTIEGGSGNAENDSIDPGYSAQKARVMLVGSKVDLNVNNLTIAGGFTSASSANGGGIFVSASSGTANLTMTNCIVKDCRATNGGGIYAKGTTALTAANITLNGCTIGKESSVCSTDSDFCNGAETGAGICLDTFSSAVLQKDLNGSPTKVLYNNASANGGGISVLTTASLTVEEGCIVNKNSAKLGGGIYCKGDAALARASATLNGCIIGDPAAESLNTTAQSQTDCGNYAITAGGGIWAGNYSDVIAKDGAQGGHTKIFRNYCAANGGGIIISSYSTGTLTNCVLDYNYAAGSGGASGGGIFSSGSNDVSMSPLTLTGCTLGKKNVSAYGTGNGIALNYSYFTIGGESLYESDIYIQKAAYNITVAKTLSLKNPQKRIPVSRMKTVFLVGVTGVLKPDALSGTIITNEICDMFILYDDETQSIKPNLTPPTALTVGVITPTVVYVDGTYTGGSSNGTEARPFTDFGTATMAAVGGTNWTIIVKGDTALTESLTIAKDGLKIKSDSEKHSISGVSNTKEITVAAKNLVFENLSFNQVKGISVIMDNSATFNECDFIENQTAAGGALWLNSDAKVFANNCNFVECKALTPTNSGEGGVVYGTGAIEFARCTFDQCVSNYGAVAYMPGGTVAFVDCTVTSCSATEEGIICSDGAKIIMDGNCSVAGMVFVKSTSAPVFVGKNFTSPGQIELKPFVGAGATDFKDGSALVKGNGSWVLSAEQLSYFKLEDSVAANYSLLYDATSKNGILKE